MKGRACVFTSEPGYMDYLSGLTVFCHSVLGSSSFSSSAPLPPPPPLLPCVVADVSRSLPETTNPMRSYIMRKPSQNPCGWSLSITTKRSRGRSRCL